MHTWYTPQSQRQFNRYWIAVTRSTTGGIKFSRLRRRSVCFAGCNRRGQKGRVQKGEDADRKCLFCQVIPIVLVSYKYDYVWTGRAFRESGFLSRFTRSCVTSTGRTQHLILLLYTCKDSSTAPHRQTIRSASNNAKPDLKPNLEKPENFNEGTLLVAF